MSFEPQTSEKTSGLQICVDGTAQGAWVPPLENQVPSPQGRGKKCCVPVIASFSSLGALARDNSPKDLSVCWDPGTGRCF